MFLRHALRIRGARRGRFRYSNVVTLISATQDRLARPKPKGRSRSGVMEPLNWCSNVANFSSTPTVDETPSESVSATVVTSNPSSRPEYWSLEELRDETDRLLSVINSYRTEGVDGERIQQLHLPDFDDVLEAWPTCAATHGIESANRACELLHTLEQHMMFRSNANVDSTVMGWNVAWHNNVMHAYAVCSGGREAAEKAQAILFNMIATCCGQQHDASDRSSLAPPEPTTRSFNIAINAWAKSGELDSGERAEEIFSKMEQWRMICNNRSDYAGAPPNARTLSGVVDAWAQSGASGAEERVLQILMHAIEKQRAFVVAQRDGRGSSIEGTIVKPNVILFNSVIHAWVNSKRGRAGAEKAEEVLRMMEELHETNALGERDESDEDDVGLRPNTRTLSLVIDAWAECENNDKSGEGASRAQELLDTMEKLYRDGQDVKPSYITFTSCITAWSRNERERGAASKAEALLDRLLSLYEETGDKDFRPTVSTFNAVISAWAKSRDKDAVKRAAAVFNRLSQFCEPDSYSYNSVMNAHAKRGHGLIAKGLLRQMEEACESGNTAACPDLVTYNTVIFALSRSSRIGSAQEAEELMKKMDAMQKEGKTGLKPTLKTHSAVIAAWGNSDDPRKAENARRNLISLIDAYKAGDVPLKPDVKAFTSTINACARSKSKHPDDMKRDLRIAIQTFEEMKAGKEYDNPNAVTYRAIMQACCRLSRNPMERFRLLQAIFQQCCQDGMVSKLVLATLREGVSRDQLATLVNVNGDRRQPFEWSRNVLRRDRPN